VLKPRGNQIRSGKKITRKGRVGVLKQTGAKKPVARKLLLKLLGSRDNVQMTAASAVRVGQLFGISENNIRVTLNRLQSTKMLSLLDRGYYQLGKGGEKFAREINSWRDAESSLLPSWNESWIAVQTNMLSKSDKKQTRENERALKIVGLRKVFTDMYVRPANIAGGAAVVREKLCTLGLSKQAVVYCASEFDLKLQSKIRNLWNTEELEKQYKQGISDVEASLLRLPNLTLEEATFESFHVGDYALHQLVFDPLLPSPLTDEALRREFSELVKHYDDVGAQIWHRFLSLDQ
jgi:phenylacetic acid degradation operon negative regulatory protein